MTTVREMRALVCGSTQGIGRACAMALANAGMSITLLARNRAALEATCAALPGGRDTHGWLEADFTDPDAVRATVGAWLEHGEPVHVLVNNTGGPPGGPLIEADESALLKAMGRLVLTPHAITKLVVPGMMSAGYGRIINVVSTSVKEPIAGLGVSNICRAAVAGWAKTLSRELPPGITVNNVLPGYTDTERMLELREGAGKRRGISGDQVLGEWLVSVPEKRLGTPDEIAAAIVFLGSPLASFIRGVSLAVDGGRLQSI
jgi:3-oxoacyl-[acyl-carrier protein] reductase